MRVGTRLAAIIGMAALLHSPLVAQEGRTDTGQPSNTTQQYFSRGGGTATQPRIGGDDRLKARPSVRRLLPRSSRRPDLQKLLGMSSETPDSPVTQASYTTSAAKSVSASETDGSKSPIRDSAVQPAGAETQEATRQAVQAGFRRGATGPRQNIQQVRVTAENTTPFLPVGTPPTTTGVSGDIPATPEVPPTTTFTDMVTATPEVDESDVSAVRGLKPELTGPQTPSVTVQWRKRGAVRVGRPCQVELVVQNNGESPAMNVVVDGWFPDTVRLTDASPRPTDRQDHVEWSFPKLAPGSEKVILVTLIPAERGALNTTAYVRFSGAASGSFTVQEPMLQVSLKGPDEVNVGEPASQTIVVTNPGTGVATNVHVQARLTSGLEHPRGNRLSMQIGSLNPGETRQLRLALAAISGGRQQIVVEAVADDVPAQRADTAIAVIAPSLNITLDGPGLRYVGRRAKYKVVVHNDGAAASSNVRALYRVPSGFRYLNSDRGGKYNSETRTIDWFVGRLEPGQKVACHVDLTAEELGKHTHLAGAISEHGTRAETKLATEVDGTASLVLEIVDLDDPVEIGTDTMYEVRVKNEGSKAAQNVGVSCEIPNGVSLVGATGVTDHVAENGLVVFKSLKDLPPGRTALFRVQVRGSKGGNHRFRARLASDSITEPLIVEELTRFYGE